MSSEACSGVRSLQTSLMIGLLFGELKRPMLERIKGKSEELPRIGWTKQNLARQRKGDAAKTKIAQHLRGTAKV